MGILLRVERDEEMYSLSSFIKIGIAPVFIFYLLFSYLVSYLFFILYSLLLCWDEEMYSLSSFSKIN